MISKISVTRVAGLAALLTLSSVAESSLIVAPHGAGRDSDLAGVVVASPDDGSSALLNNPAGVVSRARDEAMVAIAPFTIDTTYKNPETGYDGDGSTDAFALGLWRGLGERGGWSMGVGVYGSLGTAFNLPSSPEIGQTSRYLNETSILNFGLNVGKQLTPELRFGIQIAPRYGTQKIKSPSPFGDIDFDTQGFGIGASAGLVYSPADELSFGLAYRTPGRIELEGDGRVGGVKQDLTTTMITPQSVTIGVAYDWSDRLKLLSQVVWTRYKDFERGDNDFEITRELDGPLVSNTRNRSRFGVALEYEVKPGHYFRAGFTQGKAMIEDEALKPTFFDHDSDMIMAGYEVDMGGWRLGGNAGYAKLKNRKVSSAENTHFPGTYETDISVTVGLILTWELNSRQTD